MIWRRRKKKKSVVTNLNLKVDGAQNLSLVVQNQNQKSPLVNSVAQRTKNVLIALKIPSSIQMLLFSLLFAISLINVDAISCLESKVISHANATKEKIAHVLENQNVTMSSSGCLTMTTMKEPFSLDFGISREIILSWRKLLIQTKTHQTTNLNLLPQMMTFLTSSDLVGVLSRFQREKMMITTPI